MDFYKRFKNNIRTLTFSSCFMGWRLKSRQEFADAGLPVTLATWMRLQATLLHSRHALKKADESDNLTGNISNLFAKSTKGSKQFRKILCGGLRPQTEAESLRTVLQYSTLINTLVPDSIPLGKCLELWNKSFLPNDARNFLFLLRNNSLPLNNRINAFYNTVSPLCSFCRIVNRDTTPRESFSHFFLTCPITWNLIFQWTRSLNLAPDIETLDFQNLFWYGTVNLTSDDSGTTALIMDLFKYVLWKSKLRRRLPNHLSLSKELKFIIEISCFQSQKLRHRLLNNNLLANLFQAQG